MKPFRLTALASVAAMLTLSACASAPTTPPSAQAYTPPPIIRQNVRIPFADMGGVRNWRSLPDGSLLIESRQNKFFRATFFGSCPDLPFASTIGFINDLVGSLDRFSGIVVRDRVCRFSTLDEVADPKVLEAAPAPAATPASAAAPAPAAPAPAAPAPAAPASPKR